MRGMQACDDAARGFTIREDDRESDGEEDDARQCYAPPDTISYNSVLFCLTRDPAAGKDQAKEATTLLQEMQDRHARTRDPDARPDGVTYGAVLHALARAGLAPEAEAVLDALEDAAAAGRGDAVASVVPSVTIYNTVLNAWAHSHRRVAPARCEALLDRMRVLAATGRNPDAAPDAVSVATAISCHARSRTRAGAERGERLLREALRACEGGDARARPDAIMFNCAITGEAAGCLLLMCMLDCTKPNLVRRASEAGASQDTFDDNERVDKYFVYYFVQSHKTSFCCILGDCVVCVPDIF